TNELVAVMLTRGLHHLAATAVESHEVDRLVGPPNLGKWESRTCGRLPSNPARLLHPAHRGRSGSPVHGQAPSPLSNANLAAPWGRGSVPLRALHDVRCR